MLKKIYYLLHRFSSKSQERGEYSAGYWHALVRKKAIVLCDKVKGRALEACCGEGLFILALAQRHPDLEAWGIDNNALRLEKLKAKAAEGRLKNIFFAQQDATALDFADGNFDVVVCINTFFNLGSLEEVKKVLLQMKRVCRDSGRIIFDFRNSLSPALFLKYKFARLYDGTLKGLPLQAYRPEEISLLLKELGLSIVTAQGVGFWIRRFAPIVMLEVKKR